MPKKKISPINEEFDFKLLITIARKSSLILSILLLSSIISAFLIIRYSSPKYEATSILQLSMENNAKRILNSTSFQQFQDENKILASSIELMRSKVISGRVINKLPLKTSYFLKGKILTNELYRSSPFVVDFILPDSALYEKPIIIEFPSNQTYTLSYNNEGGKYETPKPLQSGVWYDLPHLKIKVDIRNFELIQELQQDVSTDVFFFKINQQNLLTDELTRNLKVAILNPEAYTVQITYQDGNPQKAADIVNGIAYEFNNYDLERNSEVADKILNFIDNTIVGIDDELKDSESQIERFKRDNAVINADHKSTRVLDRIDAIEEQLFNINTDLNLFDKLRNELIKDVDVSAFILSLSGNYENNALTEQISMMQSLLQDREMLKMKVTENSEAVKSIQLKLKNQQKLLIGTITNEEAKLKTRKRLIVDELNKYKTELSRLPRQQAEASRLQRVYGINEKFYALLLEKKAEFSITKAGYVPQHVILEEAKTNKPPISPKKPLIISACLAIAFVSGFVLILIRYLLYNEINALEEVGLYTDAALLGIVPKYKREIPISQLLVDKNPKSVISESFRSIRTNLQFISNTDGTKLVAVTSTISGEGKTFNAINLAGVIAFSGKKVIILDLDMRKPKIHLGFNVENNQGISTILINKDKAENCINKSSLANLDFITAGPIPPNPAELIISNRMNELIEWLKGLYDIIIIDLPPVGIVSDGIPIMQKADYPIYILRANYSRKMFIAQINKLITENKVHNLSIILNGIEMSRLKYGYGYGYSYGYGYGYGYSYGYGYYEDDEMPQGLFGRIRNFLLPKRS